jgi:hypothetical protein
VQKNPQNIGFSEEVFAQFEVRFDVRQILPQIVPVFLCDRMGLCVWPLALAVDGHIRGNEFDVFREARYKFSGSFGPYVEFVPYST